MKLSVDTRWCSQEDLVLKMRILLRQSGLRENRISTWFIKLLLYTVYTRLGVRILSGTIRSLSRLLSISRVAYWVIPDQMIPTPILCIFVCWPPISYFLGIILRWWVHLKSITMNVCTVNWKICSYTSVPLHTELFIHLHSREIENHCS